MNANSADKFDVEPALRAAQDTKRRHDKVAVVFDLDNTLVDTRPRTVLATQTWPDRQVAPPDHALRRMRRETVGWDGRETATIAGLHPPDGQRFHDWWDQVFWAPESFEHDLDIPNTVALLRACQEQDVEVFFLTGRIEALAGASIAQLRRWDIQAPERRLISKPRLGIATAEFKAKALRALQQSWALAWFASDSPADIAASRHVGVSTLFVDFPIGPHKGIRADLILSANVPP